MDCKSVIFDLVSLRKRFNTLATRMRRRHKEHDHRFYDDAESNKAIREYLYARVWNIALRDVKYKEDELDEDFHLNRIFKGYRKPNSQYTENGIEESSDDGAWDFYNEIVLELDDVIHRQFNDVNFELGYRLLEIDERANSLYVESYGDWRAREWCESQGVNYVP